MSERFLLVMLALTLSAVLAVFLLVGGTSEDDSRSDECGTMTC